jgi:small GTP-binding protein
MSEKTIETVKTVSAEPPVPPTNISTNANDSISVNERGVAVVVAPPVPAVPAETALQSKVGRGIGKHDCSPEDEEKDDFAMKKSSEVRFGIVGQVDAGKSTLLGVLTHEKNHDLSEEFTEENNFLDDGKGKARATILRHKHEKETGRTSSRTQRCFQYENKVINFVDLAGHEKYLNVTTSGLSGSILDYCLVVIAADQETIPRMTKEHIALATAYRLPIIIAVTKIDMTPTDGMLKKMTDRIEKMMGSKAAGKKYPIHVDNEDALDECAMCIGQKKAKIDDEFCGHQMCIDNHTKLGKSEDDDENPVKCIAHNVCPIFKVSSKTGQGIVELKKFITKTIHRRNWEEKVDEKPIFTIDGKYDVKGVGVIVSGNLKSGTVKVGDQLLLGPLGGRFKNIQIKGIHNNFQQNITELKAGFSGCFWVKGYKGDKVTKKEINADTVIIEDKTCVNSFKAIVRIMHHPTTIKKSYEPVIHCLNIRQAAKIIKICKCVQDPETKKITEGIELKTIRAGDPAIIYFRFLFRPVYMEKNVPLTFREGRTKGTGKITEIYYSEDNK